MFSCVRGSACDTLVFHLVSLTLNLQFSFGSFRISGSAAVAVKRCFEKCFCQGEAAQVVSAVRFNPPYRLLVTEVITKPLVVFLTL